MKAILYELTVNDKCVFIKKIDGDDKWIVVKNPTSTAYMFKDTGEFGWSEQFGDQMSDHSFCSPEQAKECFLKFHANN